MQNTHGELLGTANSADTYELRDFMQRSDIPFTWTELTSDEQASGRGRVAERRITSCASLVTARSCSIRAFTISHALWTGSKVQGFPSRSKRE